MQNGSWINYYTTWIMIKLKWNIPSPLPSSVVDDVVPVLVLVVDSTRYKDKYQYCQFTILRQWHLIE